MSQFHYVTTDSAGCRHAYDVHWRLVNAHRFAAALSFAELFTASTMPAALTSVRGRTPSAMHAVLIACVHRAAHHAGQGPLIWLYDIHLLAERLDAADRLDLACLAAERRLTGIAAHALTEAATVFGCPASRDLAAEVQAKSVDRAATDRYLATRGSRARAALDDLAVLHGWRPRVRLLREILFPPASYMRTGYAPDSRAPLPLLYLRRVTHGALAFFTR